eukprot:Em0001g507a
MLAPIKTAENMQAAERTPEVSQSMKPMLCEMVEHCEEDLTNDQREQLYHLLVASADIFGDKNDGLGRTGCVEHTIDTETYGSSTIRYPMEQLPRLYQRYLDYGVDAQPASSKSEVGVGQAKREVLFLGHRITREGVATDPLKTDAVQKWTVPQTTQEVQGLLGLVGYYRMYNFAAIVKPLCQHVGLGTDLSQVLHEGNEFVVAYARKTNQSRKTILCYEEGVVGSDNIREAFSSVPS